jgi:hypothetical protein
MGVMVIATRAALERLHPFGRPRSKRIFDLFCRRSVGEVVSERANGPYRLLSSPHRLDSGLRTPCSILISPGSAGKRRVSTRRLQSEELLTESSEPR